MILALFLILSTAAAPAASAEEKTLRLSCSAQIAEAIGPVGFRAFEQATGVKLDTYVCSSEAALNRLIHGHSDIAGTSEGLSYEKGVWGYVETPICTDPIAVIVNNDLPITDLTLHQLRMIFSGQAMNWNELGGPDRNIKVVIPARSTAAYKNFSRRVMRYREMHYDLMAYQSTEILQVVAKFSSAISFISAGAAANRPSIKTILVGHRSIKEKKYPFQQRFSFVTKGMPTGESQLFVDYWRSTTGQRLLQEKGMIPVTQ